MSNTLNSDKKSLLLALISGMSISALLSAFSVPGFSFSIFPLICLVLSVQAMYQQYLKSPVAEDFPMLGLGSFFIGFFGHTAFIKAQYPDAGTNFFSIIVTMVLLVWVGRKLGYFGQQS
ncbi:ATPase of the AAA+ class [Vibrio ishigakensis]|uniref:ATPase of the AAA+ class n=1 Tax=Vibrio ishigakensis TaxID=1481914 RepID=A0A0B8QXV6_9VIBR|nr:ATPase of the AAA+ class [Vibrio ishigakensis]